MAQRQPAGDRTRETLYRLYSGNFAALTADGIALTGETLDPKADPHDYYVCPLCMTPYHISALDLPRDRIPLTIEDIPPKSVARSVPKVLQLTCRDCNSTTGAQIDGPLKDWVRWLDFGPEQDETQACSLTHGANTVRANVRIDGNRGFRFEIADSAANPVEKDRFFNHLSTRNSKFNLSFRLPNVSRARISILKAAYLLMFSEFGYSYALFTRSNHDIRMQIREPDKDYIPSQAIVQLPELPVGVVAPSISIVCEPEWLASFLVVLNLRRRGRNHYWGAFLPAESAFAKTEIFDTPADLYSRLADNRPTGGGEIRAIQLVGCFPGPRTAIRQPEERHLVHYAGDWFCKS